LFNVADCKMHWQKSGDYLCVNVNRYSKIIRKEKNEVKYSVSLAVTIVDLQENHCNRFHFWGNGYCSCFMLIVLEKVLL